MFAASCYVLAALLAPHLQTFAAITLQTVNSSNFEFTTEPMMSTTRKIFTFEETLLEKEAECNQTILQYEKQSHKEGMQCPPVWHKVMCWPQTKINTWVNLSCPSYVKGFTNINGNATLKCGPNGLWENEYYFFSYFNCAFPLLRKNMTEQDYNEKKQLSLKLYDCKLLQIADKKNNLNNKEKSCPPIWRSVMCWPRAPANTLVQLKCPDYVNYFNNTQGHAKLECNANGEWNFPNSELEPYVGCLNVTEFAKHLTALKLITRIGYYISLVTLILAFMTLISMRKLKCARNYLHLNLFFSFIIRAAMCLMMDDLFTPGYLGLKRTITDLQPLGYATWDCRLFITIWHYTLMANYSWIFMEGLYLHNLIFLALFSDHSGIKQYVALGWGLPLPFLLIWVIIRITLDDYHCWTSYINTNLEWILRAPISISILINFVFFIRISMVLFHKLQVHGRPRSQENDFRHNPFNIGLKKWIKSTLVLVPLFGAYYLVLLIVSLTVTADKTAMIAWLYCDTTFTAFQGFVVAVLYCFMNGEVQGEIKRKYNSWRFNQGEFGTNQSFLTQTQTRIFTSRGGGGPTTDHISCHSLHSIEKKDTSRPENKGEVNSSLL